MAEFTLQKRGVPLAKIEPALAEHLKKLRAAAPESADFLARRMFGDTMVQGVGNKLAYEDFQRRGRKGGVHAIIDANDFGSINKRFGQSAGDEALKAMGGALSRASRANRGKLFRVGGDEFRAYFEQPEHAHAFIRGARKELESLPPVQGQHHHSVSVGLAADPEQAEQALIQAKNAKKAAAYAPGHAQTHAHSLLPGAAGPVAVAPRPEVPVMPATSAATSPVQGPAFQRPLTRSEEGGLHGRNEQVDPEVEELRRRRLEVDLQKMAVLHDGPQPIPVYRVQNDDGRGPYESGAVGDLYGQFPTFDRRAGSLPSTEDDFEPEEYERHHIGATRSGFLSPKEAHAWFGASMLGGLRDRGFTLRQVLAQKVWRSKSGRQVLFEPHGDPPAEPPVEKTEPVLPALQGDWYRDPPAAAVVVEPVAKTEDPVTYDDFEWTEEPMEKAPRRAEPSWDVPRAEAGWVRFDMPTKEAYDLRAREVLDSDGRAMPSPHVRRGVDGVERLRQLDDSVAREGIRDPIEVKDYGTASGKEKHGPAISDGHHRLMIALTRKFQMVPVTMHPDTARKLGYGPDGTRLIKAEENAAARAALEGTARVILGPLVKFEGMDDHAIRAAVIQKVHPDVDLTGKPPEYVQARFDGAVEAASKPPAPVMVPIVVESRADDIAAAVAKTLAPALEKLGQRRPDKVEYERDGEGRVIGMKLVHSDAPAEPPKE
jgi:diguanylate cyclase (GGDEF)-like protein